MTLALKCQLRRAQAPLSRGGSWQHKVLAADLLQAYAAGSGEWHVLPSEFVTTPGARPAVSALVRRQATLERLVTNPRHETMPIDTARRVPLRDGTHMRGEIRRIVAQWPAAGLKAPVDVVQQCLKRILDSFGRAAFLLH